MHVYFIGSADGTFVKIGKAIDPAKRLGSLRTSSPIPLKMLGYARCKSDRQATRIEQELHKTVGWKHSHLEWFFQPDNIKEQISQLVKRIKREELLPCDADFSVDSLPSPVAAMPKLAPPPENKPETKPNDADDSEDANMSDLSLKKIFTETELAQFLGVTPATIARERKRGKLKYTRVGTKIRFREEHIQEYLKAQECVADPRQKPKLALVKGKGRF